MDTAERREVTEGLWRSSGGYELVLSPLLLALLAFFLVDRPLGSTPWVTVAAAVLGFAGAAVKLFYGYQHDMDAHDEAGPWTRRS